MTLRAAARRGRRAFECRQRVRGPASPTRLVLLRERDLFGAQLLLAVHSRPRWRRVPAPEVFLVDRLMAAPAIAGCQLRGNRESMVIFLLLVFRALVTIEAAHRFPGM